MARALILASICEWLQLRLHKKFPYVKNSDSLKCEDIFLWETCIV